jgi:mRNA-degrading endonuclease toxin of MazEF toxin-antitoxin module
VILLDQLRTVDKRRLVSRVGTVDRRMMRETLTHLRDIFADSPD